MSIHRILIKIAYWLVAASILVIIILTFITNRMLKQQSTGKKPVTVKEAWDTETKIKFSDMNITIDDSVTSKKSSTDEKAEDTADEEEPIQSE